MIVQRFHDFDSFKESCFSTGTIQHAVMPLFKLLHFNRFGKNLPRQQRSMNIFIPQQKLTVLLGFFRIIAI